jgi:hypothetical protein
MIAVVPGYISRSVAGSYDNEGETKTAEGGLFTLLVKMFSQSWLHIYYLVIIKMVPDEKIRNGQEGFSYKFIFSSYQPL